MTNFSSGLVCKRNSWLSYWKIICKLRGNFDGRLKCSKHGIWLDRNEAKWPKRIKFPTRNIHALIFNSHSKVFIFTRFLISLSEFKHGWAWKAEELCESETNGANCNENRWTISFLPFRLSFTFSFAKRARMRGVRVSERRLFFDELHFQCVYEEGDTRGRANF